MISDEAEAWDKFAAASLQGVCTTFNDLRLADRMAQLAAAVADEMMKERAKRLEKYVALSGRLLCKFCAHDIEDHTRGPVSAKYCRHCDCQGFVG